MKLRREIIRASCNTQLPTIPLWCMFQWDWYLTGCFWIPSHKYHAPLSALRKKKKSFTKPGFLGRFNLSEIKLGGPMPRVCGNTLDDPLQTTDSGSTSDWFIVLWWKLLGTIHEQIATQSAARSHEMVCILQFCVCAPDWRMTTIQKMSPNEPSKFEWISKKIKRT